MKEQVPLLIIVPCYKNPHLIAPLLEGIKNCTKDILDSQTSICGGGGGGVFFY